MAILEDRAARENIDICILSEVNKKIPNDKKKRDQGWIGEESGDAAIWIANGRQVAIKTSSSKRGITKIILEDNTLILSCYFSPNTQPEDFIEFLDEIENEIKDHRGPIVVAGDLNAHSRTWGSARTDTRGGELEDMLARNNLFVINEDGEPTFCGALHTSFIDITAASHPENMSQWKINDNVASCSDHMYIDFNIEVSLRNSDVVRMWNPRKIDLEKAKHYINNECKDILTRDVIGPRDINDILRKSCSLASKKISQHRRGKKPTYWWTSEIDTLRKKSIAARRRYTRSRKHNNTDPATAKRHQEAYSEEKKNYHRAIIKSKQDSWKQLIDSLREDIWGLPYKIIREKVGQRKIRLTTEATEEAIKQLFPRGTLPRRELADHTIQNIPPITVSEVQRASKRMANKKAPGPDGVPAEVLKILMNTWPAKFASMVDRILGDGHFPEEWKTANLVLLPKPGKPNAYRPICLLDTVGKAVESIINNRLQEELEDNDGLSDRQYGFRAGRSTMQAIQRGTELARKEQQVPWQRRQRILMILLDVKNAFNSADWGVVLSSLKKRNISPYIRRIIESYLQDRWIMDADGKRHRMTAGVPQGSVLGPTLWNAAYDDVLGLRLPEGATAIAYADDLALIARGKTIEEVEEIAQDSINIIADWMKKSKLHLAPEKTEAVMLVKRHADREPAVSVMGHPVTMQKSARYLGVQLERGLTGVAHVKIVTEKAAKTATDIARLLPRTYGASESQRRVLSSVAESIALHASPVWAPAALQLKKNRDMLEKTQRISTIRITRAYRTTSTQALFVLARTPPWPLLAELRSELYRRYNDEQSDDSDEDNPNREELEAETLAKWQTSWNQSTKGRWTYACIPDIKIWIERRFGDLTYYTTQMLTNHGNFQQYLFRMKKTISPICTLCGSGEEDDAHHTLLACQALQQPRGQLGADSIPELLAKMMTSEEEWNRITRKIACIFKKKERLQSRQQPLTTAPT